MQLEDVRLLVHSDNQGTIGAVNKGRSPNSWINLSVRRLYSTLSRAGSWVHKTRYCRSPLVSQRFFRMFYTMNNRAFFGFAPTGVGAGNRDPRSQVEPKPISPIGRIPHRSYIKILLPGNVIAMSSLRPKVSAKQRLHKWNTPYSLRKREEESQIWSEEIRRLASDAIEGGTTDSTKSTYAAGLLRFNQFCDHLKIPEEQRMPIDPILLSAFIGKYKGSRSGNTIKSWLAGLRAWHLANGAPWLGDDARVKWARKTANREGAHHRREARAPVSDTHMRVLQKGLDLKTPKGAAVWGCACCSQYGCRRLGETTVPSQKGFNPKFHARRSTRIDFKTIEDGVISCAVDLPWTKSTREAGGLMSLTQRPFDKDGICPISALKNHITVNKDVPDHFSLFAYIDENGLSKHLTKESTILRHHSYSNYWNATNGAVELLLAGVPPEIVAQIGGWTSRIKISITDSKPVSNNFAFLIESLPIYLIS
ncbi:hypothetical protein MPER_12196 [Moniliophthora perniciosa FA553]|nr:hypothetical protein MPER_12196 [Moniliophthora perniciosa FA553]